MRHRNLESERTRIGLNQADAAEKLGVSVQSLSEYENGVRSMPQAFLVAAADFFECSTDYLLDRTPERVSHAHHAV